MRTTFPLVGLPHLTGHRVPAEYGLAVKGQYQHAERGALIKPLFIPLDAGASGGYRKPDTTRRILRKGTEKHRAELPVSGLRHPAVRPDRQ